MPQYWGGARAPPVPPPSYSAVTVEVCNVTPWPQAMFVYFNSNVLKHNLLLFCTPTCPLSYLSFMSLGLSENALHSVLKHRGVYAELTVV